MRSSSRLRSVALSAAKDARKYLRVKAKMMHEFLSSRLNADLADAIVDLGAAITIQAHARRVLANREAERKRASGEYAFHHIMDGAETNVWMSHEGYFGHMKSKFVNVPRFYFASRQSMSMSMSM